MKKKLLFCFLFAISTTVGKSQELKNLERINVEGFDNRRIMY